MKTVFFTIAILFSLSTVNAQATIENPVAKEVTIKTSKVDFFKSLVEKNNFDITIKEVNTKVANTTKKDFYNSLIEKNNFDLTIKNNIRLAHTTVNNTTKKAKTSQIVGLAP